MKRFGGFSLVVVRRNGEMMESSFQLRTLRRLPTKTTKKTAMAMEIKGFDRINREMLAAATLGSDANMDMKGATT